MRLLLSFFVLLLLGQPLAAAEPLVAPDSADYQTIRGLQAQVGAPPLPDEGAPQGTMVKALSDVAQQAATSPLSNDMKAHDYDALYALLQKYRDELRDLGAEKEDLQSQVIALRAKQHELEEKLLRGDMPLDGFKVGGTFNAFILDSGYSGPGSPLWLNYAEAGRLRHSSGDFLRQRQGVLDQSLLFTGTRGLVSASADLDFRAYMGLDPAYYLGSRSLMAEIRTPLAAQVGDLNSQLTPFTLWRSEDEDPFEAGTFKARRQRLRDELGLKDNAVHLRGLRLATDIGYDGKPILHLQGFFQGMGYPNAVLYYMASFPVTSTSDMNNYRAQYPYLPSTINNGSYNTYLALWQASTEPKGITLSYTGSLLKSSTDSSRAVYGAGGGFATPFAPAVLTPSALTGKQVAGYDSQVHSLGAKAQFMDGLAGFDAEYAESLYSNPNEPVIYDDPALGHTGYSVGAALRAQVESKSTWLHLAANFRQVDSNFISTAAQGRTQDTQMSVQGPFPHDNVQYNPANGLFFDSGYLSMQQGATEYTRAFLPPQYMDRFYRFHGNYLLPYNYAVNPSTPYGLATPNRQGYGVNAEFTPWAGFTPRVIWDDSAQAKGTTVTAAEHYTLQGAGLDLDLQALLHWPFTLNGGFQQRGVDNGAAVSLKSATIDLGATWAATPALLFFTGAKHMDYQGALAHPLYGGYGNPMDGSLLRYDPQADAFKTIPVAVYTYDQAFDSFSVGLRYRLAARASIELYYGNEYFADHLAEAAGLPTAYEMDQGYIRYSMDF